MYTCGFRINANLVKEELRVNVGGVEVPRARILVQVMIHRRLLIGRDGRLDQSEAYDVS